MALFNRVRMVEKDGGVYGEYLCVQRSVIRHSRRFQDDRGRCGKIAEIMTRDEKNGQNGTEDVYN